MIRSLPILLALGCASHHELTPAPVLRDPHHPASVRWSREAGIGDPDAARLLLVGELGRPRTADARQRLLVEACDQAGGCDAVLLLGDVPWRWDAGRREEAHRLEAWVQGWPAPAYVTVGPKEWGPLRGWVHADRVLDDVAYLPRRGVDARGAGHHYAFSAGPMRVSVIDPVDLRRTCPMCDALIANGPGWDVLAMRRTPRRGRSHEWVLRADVDLRVTGRETDPDPGRTHRAVGARRLGVLVEADAAQLCARAIDLGRERGRTWVLEPESGAASCATATGASKEP